VSNAEDLPVSAAVDVDRQPVAGPEQIAVDEIPVEQERLPLRVAHAAAQLRRGAFFDRHVDVDQIRSTFDAPGLGLHLFDVR
jgi:hypothetical protein